MTNIRATPLAGHDRDRSGTILPVWVIVALVVTSMAAAGAAVALFRAAGWDWWVLLRDPAAAFKFTPVAGVFSHIGVLAMTGMGAICVFAALLLPRAAQDRGILAYAGILSLWLAADDMFMLHEGILPRRAGIPERATLAAYVVLALGLMWRIGGRVLTPAFLGLWVAAAFLLVMLCTDVVFDVATSASFLVEEIAKLCGFVLWAAFWIAFAAQTMRGALAAQALHTPGRIA